VLEGAQIYVDPHYPPPAMADLLARTTRLLQVALDQQFQENEQAVRVLNVSLLRPAAPVQASWVG